MSNFLNIWCVLGVFFQIHIKSAFLLSFNSFAFFQENNFGKWRCFQGSFHLLVHFFILFRTCFKVRPKPSEEPSLWLNVCGILRARCIWHGVDDGVPSGQILVQTHTPQVLYRYSGDLWIKPKWKLLILSGILNDSIYLHLSFTKRNPHEAAQEYFDHGKRRKLTENNRVETLKMTSLNDQLKPNPWPLEKSIFESLPPRLRKGLCFRLFPVTLSCKLWLFVIFFTLVLRSIA